MSPARLRRVLYSLVALAVIIGLFARFYRLGVRPLAVDEYYSINGILAVLRSGVPELPGGGYYVRGLLVQYVTAGFMLVLGENEFSLRLPSVLFGLAAVAAAYAYARRYLGRELALALAAVLLISSWQIEFARFGRMYPALQFFALAFLVALHDSLTNPPSARRQYLPHGLAVAAAFTHQSGLFLMPLLALPFVVPPAPARVAGRWRALQYVIVSSIAVLAAFSLYRAGFLRSEIPPRFPVDYVPPPEGNLIVLPAFPFWSVSADPAVNLAAAVGLVAVLGVILLGLRRYRAAVEMPEVLAGMLLVTASVHAFVPTAILAAVLLGRYRIHRRLRERPFAAAATALGVAISIGWVAYAGWLTYGLGSREWIAAGGAHLFRDGFRLTFLWPFPYQSVIVPWFREMPVLAAILLAGLLLQIVRVLPRSPQEIALSPAVVVVYFFLVLGSFAPTFMVTRYTFFLYPIALTALALTMRNVVTWAAARGRKPSTARSYAAAAGLLLILLFGVTEDFNPTHISSVTSRDATYRVGRFQRFHSTWYDRDDFRSPAKFVREAARPEEQIIVADVPPVSYYIGRNHAIYLDRGSHRFSNVARQRGTVDFWTGNRLLSTPGELSEHTRGDLAVWIVWPASEWKPFRLGDVWDGDYHIERRFLNGDESIEVLRVSPSRWTGMDGPESAYPGSGGTLR